MQYKMCRTITVSMLLSLLTFGCAETETVNFYVSPNGNDSWSGTLPAPNTQRSDGPFKSLTRARDAIRILKQKEKLPGSVTVHIRRGFYFPTQTFELTTNDSGSRGAPIVYRAYKNEEVRIIGGKQVTGFAPIDDTVVLDRIEKAYHDKILQIDLKSQGITDFGELKPRGFGRPMYSAALELFFQDKPMQLARWPNHGWIKIAAVPKAKQAGRFTYEGDRPKQWIDANDVWLHGYWTQEWADSYEKVKSINTQTREIATYKPHGVYGYTAGKRYYALNIMEELDEPGEWYLNRKSGILYFWPPAQLDQGKAFVSILEKPIVSMQDVSCVTLQGLTLECTRGTAIKVTGGSHNIIAHCTFRNIGNVAVSIDGGADNGVLGCSIYDTGDGGIRLNGGDRLKLTPAGHYAKNNYIHHYSRWVRTYRPAVMIRGVGNFVAHNLIHDGPHTAILLGGNDHLIEFNEIHNVCYETGDVGAFYMGRDWTTRGNVIRYNYFHDISGPYTHGAMAVYLDDCASGTTIFGNVFYKASRAAFIGGGRDNIIENNIFKDCVPAVHIDQRAKTWAKEGILQRRGSWNLFGKLEAVKHRQPPYSTRYPKLAAILDDDPLAPKGNIIVHNVVSGGRWLDLQGVDRKIVTIKDNFVGPDPDFVDPAKMNFQLKDDSPAYQLGFKRIPIEKIGLTDHFVKQPKKRI